MGYENEYQVSKVGDVARRGGIIDVFSPSTSKPVRIEFFGDEIESIRIFSISSQLSTGEAPLSAQRTQSRETPGVPRGVPSTARRAGRRREFGLSGAIGSRRPFPVDLDGALVAGRYSPMF